MLKIDVRKLISFDRAMLAELEKIYAAISESYNDVMKSYYSQDIKTAFQIEVSTKGRIEMCDKFLERYTSIRGNPKCKISSPEQLAVAQIIENLKATATSIKNIARVVLCYE